MLGVLRFQIHKRFFAIKHHTEAQIKYTNSINLPATKFPSRLSKSKREELEQNLLETTFAGAYAYQQENKPDPPFVLHDGPPYANGDLHMGHAVNKILKDITLRQHTVKGEKVNYIAGWDCHGLPIELRALNASERELLEENEDDEQMALSIREKSRKFALDAIDRQKDEFSSWGILTDWSYDNIYLTFKPEFITNQLKMFYILYESGLVYRDLKPVYWSPSSKSALAEAELEYQQLVSPSVYIRFALTEYPESFPNNVKSKIYALVWTTTPWTLPSNEAICYNAALDYNLVKLENGDKGGSDDLYLIAANLQNELEVKTQMKYTVVQTIKGSELSNCTYQHPIFKEDVTMPFFAAAHVLDTKGTGLVHTAPAHGPEDFLVSLTEKLPVRSYVDESGYYTADAPDFLRGESVVEWGDKLVLAHIAKDVVFSGKLEHSCPIDWRTKKPVIIRASEQWFINTDMLKQRAVEAIDKIQIFPRVNADASKKALIAQIRKRPYWCISRQRAWGVPIPVLYEKYTGEVVTNRSLITHLANLLRTKGTMDFWWSMSVAELVPRSILRDLNCKAEDLHKGTDIFDIWFDSGSTWSAVLEGAQIADLCLEGYDQFNGWFQSSLLTSIAARNCAPYKALFVHGFTVDANGHKMSKSRGNVISPKAVIKKHGRDTLRWWVASHATQNMSITVSDNLFQQAADSLGRIRNTLRYLQGVIGTRETEQTDVNFDKTIMLNKYLLSSLIDFEQEIEKSYNFYEYNRVVAIIQNFVAKQISTIYVHSIKDRLYCGHAADLSCIRYAVMQCYKQLCKALWPLAPFLVEESWSYYDIDTKGFQLASIESDPGWKNEKAELVINAALDVKRVINQMAKKIGCNNSWLLDVTVTCDSTERLQLLQQLQPTLDLPLIHTELSEILQVGSVQLNSRIKRMHFEDDLINVQLLRPEPVLCARCRRFETYDTLPTCWRCTEILQENRNEN